MVPDTLRNINPAAYTPRIISIGPLHKEDQHLRAMEEHQVAYMYRLFCRTVESTKKDMEQTTNRYVQAVFGLVTRARACYAPSFTTYDDFRLAEMMVIDGCFILEILYRFHHEIADGDPISDNILMKQDVKCDLLLLENQILFFILQVLFSLTLKRILKSDSLTTLVFDFFKDTNILNSSVLTTSDETVEHCHILGLFQSCYRPSATDRRQVPTISYSATEIAGAGVTFKAHKDEKCLLAVTVNASQTLFFGETKFKIPVLCINNATESFLRNLIAYEQCYPLCGHCVTSFAFLMGRLINTKDDVAFLVRSKVLHHSLGASKNVLELFNNIFNGVVLEDFCYSDQCEQLDEYCKGFWPSISISLRHIGRGTFRIVSVSAVILFIFMLVQTIFTVRSGL